MTEPIQIVDYDPAWPIDFARLRIHLLAAIEHVGIAIEHVGSTAVPSLPAKPILDVDVVVNSSNQVGEAIARLAEIGYTHLGDLGIAGREAFANPPHSDPPHAPAHHLYVVVRGSEAWRNHIEFRNYLREHPETVEAYSKLKRSLTNRFKNNRDEYTEAKTEFVENVLRAVREVKM